MQEVKGSLTRRNRREAAEVVPEGPWEEEMVESESEEENIVDAAPLRIRVPGARARGGPTSAAILAPIDPGMWLSIINVNKPHLADLEVESMKKIIFDYERYSQKCS